MSPFCYYCDRDFPDEKVLIQHQKAKHFKCLECQKRLNTATALSLHYLSVHKKELTEVPFALLDRCKTDLEIHGLEGVPFALIEKRAKDRNLDLPERYAEPVRPPIKKKKLIQSQYMQYYAQYYRYPTAQVVPTTNEASDVKSTTNPVAEQSKPKEKKHFPLDEIPYDLPQLNDKVHLTMTFPLNIYEDIKFRAFMESK